jgi:hypothetical protein
MTEEHAAHFGQRQYSDQRTGPLRYQIMRAVPEDLLDQIAPFDPVKERRIGATGHETRPGRAVSVGIRTYGEPCGHRCGVGSVHA